MRPYRMLVLTSLAIVETICGPPPLPTPLANAHRSLAQATAPLPTFDCQRFVMTSLGESINNLLICVATIMELTHSANAGQKIAIEIPDVAAGEWSRSNITEFHSMSSLLDFSNSSRVIFVPRENRPGCVVDVRVQLLCDDFVPWSRFDDLQRIAKTNPELAAQALGPLPLPWSISGWRTMGMRTLIPDHPGSKAEHVVEGGPGLARAMADLGGIASRSCGVAQPALVRFSPASPPGTLPFSPRAFDDALRQIKLPEPRRRPEVRRPSPLLF